MGFFEFLFLIVVLAVVGAIVQHSMLSKKQDAMSSHLDGLDDFTPTQKIIGSDGSTGLAVDEGRKKLCLILNGKTLSERVISYKDIMSVELFEDGTSLSKTVRTSQLAGMLVGGFVLGGVGAVIGGLSGTTKTIEKVRRVDLRLIVNDITFPTHNVCFLNLETKKTGIIYSHALQQARHWQGLVEVLIKRADAEDKATSPAPMPIQSNSMIADELLKLANLKTTGLLTSEEYDQQKTRLLRDA